MPSTTSSTVSTVAPNSTATMPVGPVRSKASATSAPSLSSLAAMQATARTPLKPSIGRRFFQVRNRLFDRQLQSFDHIDGVGPGLEQLQSVLNHGVGENGRRRRAVARDVVGLLRDL